MASTTTLRGAVRRRIKLRDGQSTTIYFSKYKHSEIKPRLVVFKTQTSLLDWCRKHQVDEAITGGYDLHHTGTLLGDTWTDGKQHPSVEVPQPWSDKRGSLHIHSQGIELQARKNLPRNPSGDLIQAGPLLVKQGRSLIQDGYDHEGFSAVAYQFTPDPSVGRHPRSAIGLNRDYIWAVVCDGRKPGEAGLTLVELADVMITLGATSALNLDGGSSTTLIHDRKLVNNPRGQQGDVYAEGLPISTAIVFEPVR